ncbi:hypothetical protein DWG18_12715 [Lysobacter sp. TY2-98]|uniref:hypothetical protein n=1 Tax=Lysobacter sp. TY2-98 TaxID=2290922 RepID=UPI000E1FD006|nr:hypothetical protein [Lysobacter sp. TY2-98]AXK73053.1 hypothetical protein DWG18_12715 [Lysobacter sp. TY2-98]
MFRRRASVVLLALLLAGPVIASPPAIDPAARNPPPTIALSHFDRFELQPVTLAPGLETHKGNVVARQYLDVDVGERVPRLIEPRNATPVQGEPRTLLIQPEVADIRFITGGKRVLFGGFAGSSWALVKLRLVDKATGEVVAEPQFLQHANSIAAGYSLGAADKLMLARLADMVASYLKTNFDAPVGSAVAAAAPPMD